MVLTALSHALISVSVSLVAWFFGDISIGIAIALSFYVGREVAQHERNTRGTDPLRGFYVWKWSLDAKLDLLFPVIACFALYFGLLALK